MHRNNFPCAIVGIDVAGGEEWFPKPTQSPVETPTPGVDSVALTPDLHTAHVAALKRAQELKLNITIHAGEDTNYTNIAEAIFEHGAKRIGHGYHLVEDMTLMAKAVEMGIHFEVCPTSSYETGGWAGSAAEEMNWSQHPMNVLIGAGASVNNQPCLFNKYAYSFPISHA